MYMSLIGPFLVGPYFYTPPQIDALVKVSIAWWMTFDLCDGKDLGYPASIVRRVATLCKVRSVCCAPLPTPHNYGTSIVQWTFFLWRCQFGSQKVTTNFFHLLGKRSANWSWDYTCGREIAPETTYWQIKWQLTSMCFVRSWKTGFVAMYIALVLYAYV